LFCYDAPCTHACPPISIFPRFIKKIATGNLRGSAATIFASNLLGRHLRAGMSSAELCEGACVLGSDHKPIAIGRLQRLPWTMAGSTTAIGCYGHAFGQIDCCHRRRARGAFVLRRVGYDGSRGYDLRKKQNARAALHFMDHRRCANDRVAP